MRGFQVLFSIVPIAAGIMCLISAWSTPFTEARMIGTVVAAVFVFVGIGIATGGLSPKNRLKSMVRDLAELQRELHQELKESGLEPASNQAPSSSSNYRCPNCSATLGDRSDVSPHGDAKCQHCHRWFNIHGANPRTA